MDNKKMTTQTQTQVGRENRVPLEKRVVVLRDGSEIKFSDLSPQRQEVLYELDRELPHLESVNYPIKHPGILNATARVELKKEMDIPDMYRRLRQEMKDDTGIELMKSFFAGDIYGRCDDLGRISYRSGKFRHFMSLGFAMEDIDSASGFIDYGRSMDFQELETYACGHESLCPNKTCESSAPNRFASFDIRHYCNTHYKRVDGTGYRVNFPDNSMRWSTLEPGVIHLVDNYDQEEIVTDSKRIDVFRKNAKEMWDLKTTTIAPELKRQWVEFPALEDMWSLKK
jgi:hypothetical protein